MKVRPSDDRVLIRIEKEEDKITSFGLILPAIGDKKQEKGEVVAIGPGKLLESGVRAVMTVKIGDKIVFEKYTPSKVEVDGEELFFIKEADILAVIE